MHNNSKHAPPINIRVALVHNHHQARNAYLLPQLEIMCAELGASLTLISWQPPLRSHSLAMAVWRDWLYYRLQLAWSRYRLYGLRRAVGITKTFLARTLPGYLGAAHRAKMCRVSQIETLVTAKHIAAWQAFLDSDATHLLCCEDDLIFKADSIEQMKLLCADLDSGSGLRYFDVAGGLPVDTLGLDRLRAGSDGRKTRFARATTNTACGYILSRPLAERFMAQLIGDPTLRLIGIDWMMNALLMQLNAAQIACDALHFNPPIFGHGTFTGEYVSWMQTALKSGTHA